MRDERLEVTVTFDERRGYIASAAELQAQLSRIAQLDQRTALPDQCLHSAEADMRPPRRKSGFDPKPTWAAQNFCGANRPSSPISLVANSCFDGLSWKANFGMVPSLRKAMRRRDFIAGIAGSAAAFAARAQQPAIPVVEFMHAGVAPAHTHVVAALRQGLKESGYVESSEPSDRISLGEQ